MGIGEALARRVTVEGANVALFARSKVSHADICLSQRARSNFKLGQTASNHGGSPKGPSKRKGDIQGRRSAKL